MPTRSRQTEDQPDSGLPDRPAPEPEPKTDSGTEYLNVTSGPVTYTRDGHQVGGGEWTPPVNLDAIGQAARHNRLILPRSAL